MFHDKQCQASPITQAIENIELKPTLGVSKSRKPTENTSVRFDPDGLPKNHKDKGFTMEEVKLTRKEREKLFGETESKLLLKDRQFAEVLDISIGEAQRNSVKTAPALTTFLPNAPGSMSIPDKLKTQECHLTQSPRQTHAKSCPVIGIPPPPKPPRQPPVMANDSTQIPEPLVEPALLKSYFSKDGELFKDCVPGELPPGVKKHRLRRFNDISTPGPYYPNSKILYHFKTFDTITDTQYDDSSVHTEPMELILGKQFKMKIWEIIFHTLRKGEKAQYKVPKDMCLNYPAVVSVLRKSYLMAAKKPSVNTLSTCCASLANGTGYPDLDSMLREPRDLTFWIELVDVKFPGTYEMESWHMTDKEKQESLPILKAEGNALVAACRFFDATAKYYEALARIELLMTREVPHGPEYKEIQMEKLPFLLNLSHCLIKLREFHQAKTYLDQVIILDPNCVKAYYRRGICNRGLGEWISAKVDFWHSAELDKTLLRSVDEQMVHIQFEQAEFVKIEKARCRRMLETFQNHQ